MFAIDWSYESRRVHENVWRRSLCFRNVHFCGVFFADLGLINGLVHPLNFHHLSWEDARRGRSSRRRVGLSSSWKRRGWSAPCGQPCTGAQKCARPWNVPQMLSMHCLRSARRKKVTEQQHRVKSTFVRGWWLSQFPAARAFLVPILKNLSIGWAQGFVFLFAASWGPVASVWYVWWWCGWKEMQQIQQQQCVLPDRANWWKAISLPGQHRVCWIQSTPKITKPNPNSILHKKIVNG